MKAKTTEKDLEVMGFEDTCMRIGKSQIWQSKYERIIYDAEEEMILARYAREFREQTHLMPYARLGVGRRQE